MALERGSALRESAACALPLVMVHGGLPPQETFSAQRELERRRPLLAPSLPIGSAAGAAGRRRDFARDGEALAGLLAAQAPAGAHLLGVSYGAVSALACAVRAPALVRSLTLVEAPLFALALDVPHVARFVAALERPFDRAVCTRAEASAAFAAFTSPGVGQGPDVGARIAGVMSFVRGARPPAQARLDLQRLRAAGVPALVVSGAHHEALSVVSARLAEQLGAQLLELPGWGHSPQRSPQFNGALARFLDEVEAGTRMATAGMR